MYFISQASTDQSAVDMNIPFQVASFAVVTIQLLGVIVVMSQAAWQVFLIFIPVTAISLWCQVNYLNFGQFMSYMRCDVALGDVLQSFTYLSWFYFLFFIFFVCSNTIYPRPESFLDWLG